MFLKSNLLWSLAIVITGFSGCCNFHQDRVTVISSSIVAKMVTGLHQAVAVRGLIYFISDISTKSGFHSVDKSLRFGAMMQQFSESGDFSFKMRLFLDGLYDSSLDNVMANAHFPPIDPILVFSVRLHGRTSGTVLSATTAPKSAPTMTLTMISTIATTIVPACAKGGNGKYAPTMSPTSEKSSVI